MGAVVTTFLIRSEEAVNSYCGLHKWCATADTLLRGAFPAAEVIVFTNRPGLPVIRKECPNARVVPFDDQLLALANRWGARSVGGRRSKEQKLGGCPSGTLMKWQVLELAPGGGVRESGASLAMREGGDA